MPTPGPILEPSYTSLKNTRIDPIFAGTMCARLLGRIYRYAAGTKRVVASGIADARESGTRAHGQHSQKVNMVDLVALSEEPTRSETVVNSKLSAAPNPKLLSDWAM